MVDSNNGASKWRPGRPAESREQSGQEADGPVEAGDDVGDRCADLVGGPSGSPVTPMIPERAWAKRSKDG